MHKLNHFIGRITRYLSNRESDTERTELYEAYDRVNEAADWTDRERTQIAVRAKRRIFRSIRAEQRRGRRKLTYGVSAAAAILILAGAVYWFTLPQDRIARTEELVSLVPGQEHAIIILPTGETVNLDHIAAGQSVQVGNTVISKNDRGEISYESISVEENPIYTLQTPKSTVSEIVLADGTRVVLNAESKLFYPAKFDDGDRVVHVEGEAYFQVTQTPGKSRFIVKTAEQQVIVTGTKFNIKAYHQDHAVWTTLEEGAVTVAAGDEQQVALTPGLQAVYTTQELKTQKVNVAGILGWTKGVFHFDGTNTLDVLQEIERWYDIDITYKENKGDMQYIGKIPRNLSLDQLVNLLTYADFKVEPRIDQKKRINLIIN